MLDEIRKEKLKKLEELKKSGINPYPSSSKRTHTIKQALDDFDNLSGLKENLALVGRIMARREHGGSVFIDLDDGASKIQAYLKQDVLGEEKFKQFNNLIDIGDFLEVEGILFLTKKSEKTIEVKDFRLLSKALLPLPEKWHGLQDVEERLRKRYLDVLFNHQVKKVFETRSNIYRAIRDFMNQNNFLEVTTPTLQPLYGGASARPFKTHLNALNLDTYLRIAPELYLKRLLVGGFTAVYEFTTNFRNEGIDRDHNPEFSGVEFYAAYKDLDWAMKYTEEMFDHVLNQVLDKKEISYQGKDINFKTPYAREKFSDLLKKHTGIDYDKVKEADLKEKADELGIVIEKTVGKAGLADELFKKVVRPKITDPTFVTDFPLELLPLAKRIGESEYVSAFQFYAGGLELIKAFSELNDPQDQRARMQMQENQRAKGDEEAQRMDEDYIEAMEYGMPPAAGWGLGLDRFVMLLTDSHSIRDVILFPLMKPKE